MVDRYAPLVDNDSIGRQFAYLAADDRGSWVRHEDYATLEAERDEALHDAADAHDDAVRYKNERDAWVARVRCWAGDIPTFPGGGLEHRLMALRDLFNAALIRERGLEAEWDEAQAALAEERGRRDVSTWAKARAIVDAYCADGVDAHEDERNRLAVFIEQALVEERGAVVAGIERLERYVVPEEIGALYAAGRRAGFRDAAHIMRGTIERGEHRAEGEQE